MDLGLAGKKSLVAGAGRGIGKAIALELAREGSDVVIVSRTLDELERSAQEIAEETGGNVTAMAVDVTQRDQVDRVVAAAAERMGGLHILVNSASLPGGSASAVGPIDTVNEDDLLSDFDVKYVGALRCARASIPFMKEQGWGRIVNISGGNGRTAGNLSGGARNVAMVHLTKTLSNQMGRFGITVNCIHPGTTRTERTPGLLEARAAQLGITAEEMETQDFAPDSARGNAICRMVDASEVAYLTAYLASDKAWAVTGEVIAAGGGTGTAVYY
jgi:NAD(P)-dependent dehydrogenase (short-subunit alcohol dehydrogenase family)